MDSGDEESFFSCYILDSVHGDDVLSLEDLAWVDSCLIKDSEKSDSNWDALKNVLLPILTSQRESHEFSSARRGGFKEGNNFENFCSGKEAKTPPDLERRRSVDDEEVERSSDEESGSMKSGIKFPYPFLPNYSEYPKETDDTDPWLDLTFPSKVEDIFKVWELDGPAAEEDELINQLNKAIEESSTPPMPSTYDDSEKQKDLKQDSLGDLVDGISDLSLS